jgi:hypothetical protein
MLYEILSARVGKEDIFKLQFEMKVYMELVMVSTMPHIAMFINIFECLLLGKPTVRFDIFL